MPPLDPLRDTLPPAVAHRTRGPTSESTPDAVSAPAPYVPPSQHGAGAPYPGGRVVSLTHDGEWAALEPAWDALATAAPQRLPMLGPVWVRAFARHRLAPSETLTVHVAHTAGRLVGLLPVIRRPGRLGPTLRAPRDDHTRAGDALLATDAPGADLLGLLGAAFRACPTARSLTLAGVRDVSPTTAGLPATQGPCFVVAADDERGSYAPLAGRTMADVRAALPDNFRRNLRKAGNRLTREARVAFGFDEGADADPATLDTFLTLEASGWKGRSGTAIGLSPTLRAFYADLVAGFSAAGRLAWHRLDIGGTPAAMFLGVRCARALVLVKIAYDERFARLGPGNLLFERLLERETSTGTCDEVNCTTDMPWHRLWALPRSTYARVQFVPRRVTPFLTTYVPSAVRARLRRVAWLRRALSRSDGAATGPTEGDA